MKEFQEQNIQLNTGEKIYFASDFHFGVPSKEKSIERERKVVSWLDKVSKDAKVIYLVGDIFDFWFEYKNAIPKGHIRFIGKLAELVDKGIKIEFFTGNHDMWMFDYFTKELGIIIHRKPIIIDTGSKKLFIGHGDGLGPGDRFYKFLKAFFASKVCQWLFARIHPNLGIGIANYWSKKSRLSNTKKDETLQDKEKEWLWLFCKEIEEKAHHDYYIFGHRHLPLNLEVNQNSKYINLGEWVNYTTYCEFDGEKAELKEF